MPQLCNLRAVVVTAMIVTVSGTCTGVSLTSRWFDMINYCAWNSASSLSDCVSNNDDKSFYDSWLDGEASTPTDSGRCAITYFNSVSSLLTGGVRTKCGGDDPNSLRSGYCLRLLSSAITTFNTCAGIGVDIVTGDANGRCSSSDALAFNRDQDPWYNIMYKFANPTTTMPVFTGNCASCAQKMADRVFTTPNPYGCVAEYPFPAECRGGFNGPLDGFTQCTGGFETYSASRTSQCVASPNWAIAESIFVPFNTLYDCRNAVGKDRCYAEKSGFFAQYWGNSGPCGGCLDNVADAITTTCSSASSAAECRTLLGGYLGPLEQYEVCAGSSLTTRSTECSAAPSSPVLSSLVDFVFSATPFDLATVPAPVGATCESCYKGLAWDISARKQGDNMMESYCTTEPETCIRDIPTELARLESCAGFSVTKCSVQQLASLGSLAQDIYAGIKSESDVVALLTGLDQTLPCAVCFKSTARTLLLQQDQVRSCATGGNCDLAQELSLFNSCSGATLEWTDLYPPDSNDPNLTTSTTTNNHNTSSPTSSAAAIVGIFPILAAILLLIQ